MRFGIDRSLCTENKSSKSIVGVLFFLLLEYYNIYLPLFFFCDDGEWRMMGHAQKLILNSFQCCVMYKKIVKKIYILAVKSNTTTQYRIQENNGGLSRFNPIQLHSIGFE